MGSSPLIVYLNKLDNSAKSSYAIVLFSIVIADISRSYHYRISCCKTEIKFEFQTT